MHKSLRTSQTHLPQRQTSQRKLSNGGNLPQPKQSLKAPYFNIVQRIFTEEILQNKRTGIRNSKIKYFFGAIFHGLKKGTIKPSLSDFMGNADKIFKEAKVTEIREILEEYKRIQEQQRGEEKTVENEPVKVEKMDFTFKEGLGKSEGEGEKRRSREGMEEITKLNSEIENRRNRIVEEKQRILEKLGNFENYYTPLKQNVKRDERTPGPNESYERHPITASRRRDGHVAGLITNRNSQFFSSPHIKPYSFQPPSCRKGNEFFSAEDKKLNQLNDKLEYYLSLNKKHLANSRSTRQQYIR